MMSSPSRREPVLVSTEFVLHRSPYHSMESVYYYCHICKQPFDYGESLRELDPEVKCPTCKDTFVERVVDRGTPQDTGDGVQSQMVPGSSVPLLREGGTGFIQPSQPAIPTSVITHPTRPGGSPINLSRREGSSINPTRPDGSSANLTRPEGPPINLTRPEGSSSLGGSNRSVCICCISYHCYRDEVCVLQCLQKNLNTAYHTSRGHQYFFTISDIRFTLLMLHSIT
jgi:hypothetical protein